MSGFTLNNPYWIQRTKRHLLLAAVAVVTVLLVYWAAPPPLVRSRLSVGLAYAALAFLVAVLWLGPWNVLRKKPNPVSSDLRRDIGIWTGILALAHTGIGLTVHLPGRMWRYFFQSLHPLRLQFTKFGIGNYFGLLAALLFLVLLAISNDLSLRKLGTRRWKSVQRWTYFAFALTLAHAVAYQLLEKRHLPWVLFLAVLSLTAIAIQIAGYRRISARRSQN